MQFFTRSFLFYSFLVFSKQNFFVSFSKTLKTSFMPIIVANKRLLVNFFIQNFNVFLFKTYGTLPIIYNIGSEKVASC